VVGAFIARRLLVAVAALFVAGLVANAHPVLLHPTFESGKPQGILLGALGPRETRTYRLPPVSIPPYTKGYCGYVSETMDIYLPGITCKLAAVNGESVSVASKVYDVPPLGIVLFDVQGVYTPRCIVDGVATDVVNLPPDSVPPGPRGMDLPASPTYQVAATLELSGTPCRLPNASGVSLDITGVGKAKKPPKPHSDTLWNIAIRIGLLIILAVVLWRLYVLFDRRAPQGRTRLGMGFETVDEPTADEEVIEILRRRVSEAIQLLDEGADARQAVLVSWRRFETAIAAGIGERADSETSFELARRALEAYDIDPSSLERLHELFLDARYSSRRVGEEEREVARDLLRTLQGQIAQQPVAP